MGQGKCPGQALHLPRLPGKGCVPKGTGRNGRQLREGKIAAPQFPDLTAHAGPHPCKDIKGGLGLQCGAALHQVYAQPCRQPGGDLPARLVRGQEDNTGGAFQCQTV